MSLSNVAASVRQRLLSRAREEGEDVQRLLVRYALERMLYRITASDQARSISEWSVLDGGAYRNAFRREDFYGVHGR